MSRLELSLACGVYDRTAALKDGTVEPVGIDLNFIPLSSRELFRRQARNAEFDVAEFSLATYCILKSRGDQRMTAIPVFTSRRFRHSHVFVNRDLVTEPQDLVGKRIGSAEYQNTATTWVRGILKDDYGVDPEDVTWLIGGLNSAGRHSERIPIDLPSSLTISHLPPDRSLNSMLVSGDLEAVITPRVPDSYGKVGHVQRLFSDYEAIEREYFGRTHVFPIMHTVVIKEAVYERSPWVAHSLIDAFEEAKAVGISRLRHTGAPFCSLPWLNSYIERIDDWSGGQDLFAYGLDPNRHVLEIFLDYCYDQGLLERPLDMGELFLGVD